MLCKKIAVILLSAYETAPAAPGEETPVGDPKELYRVQTGAYGVKENAEAMKARLQEAGFDAVIVKA